MGDVIEGKFTPSGGEAAPGKDYVSMLQNEGFEFEFPNLGEYLPTDISHEGFEEFPTVNMVENMAASFRDYLTMFRPTRDPFEEKRSEERLSGEETHELRRKWRHAKEREDIGFNDFWHKNKLKYNNYQATTDYLKMLIELLDTDNIKTPQADAIRALAKDLPKINDKETYNGLSLTALIEASKKIDDIARKYLRLVGRAPSKQATS